MKKISVNEFSFSIPSTPMEWELYCSMEGVENAANELTQALIKAIGASSHKDAKNIMRSAMEKNANYGATDTEPRAIAEQYLTKVRNKDFTWSL